MEAKTKQLERELELKNMELQLLKVKGDVGRRFVATSSIISLIVDGDTLSGRDFDNRID